MARAQSEATATDGATGSGTAAFLREESTGDDVVQSLLETTAAPEAAEVVVDEPNNEAETAAATDSVIGDLVDQAAAPDRADPGATPSDSESGPDRGVIDDLLGGGDR